MSKVMIITVGTGEGVDHGIVCSIRQQNPTHIVFLLTPESKDKTLPLILQDKAAHGRKIEEAILADGNDIAEIRDQCQKTLERIMKGNYDPSDIAVDFTSGTKAMSVGLALAALGKRVKTLVYVSGKRDKNGRVISGAERPIPIEPNRIYGDLLLQEAVDLFNGLQFDACLEIVTQAAELTMERQFQDMLMLLKKLTEAYSLWDRFCVSKAFSSLDKLSDNSLLAEWGIKSRIGKNKEVLFKEKQNLFCLERIADLLENARRRGEIEKKYDDACARLYRLIEYIAQFQTNKRGFYLRKEKGQPETDNLDITKLPAHLQKKYLEKRNPKDNRVRLGLHGDYELLFDLGDQLGVLFRKEYNNGELKRLLSLRNNSILAHGFCSVSERTYEEMVGLSERIVKTIFPEIEGIMDKVEFPNIKISREKIRPNE